jgi:hypothetical protein
MIKGTSKFGGTNEFPGKLNSIPAQLLLITANIASLKGDEV